MSRRITIPQRDKIRFAKAMIKIVKRDDEIPPIKAIEELTRCIRALQGTNEWYSTAEALHIRGRAAACGMEDHKVAFRDWRRALRLINSNDPIPPNGLRLMARIKFNMGLHAEGATRMRYYNQAMALSKKARWPQGEALVVVHRGLAWRERGVPRKAIRDLEEGLRLARLYRMGEIRSLKRFILEARSASKPH